MGFLKIVLDQSEPPDTLEQAYYALSNYELSDQERLIAEHWELGN